MNVNLKRVGLSCPLEFVSFQDLGLLCGAGRTEQLANYASARSWPQWCVKLSQYPLSLRRQLQESNVAQRGNAIPTEMNWIGLFEYASYVLLILRQYVWLAHNLLLAVTSANLLSKDQQL